MTTCTHPKTVYLNPKGGRPFMERPSGHSGASAKIPCRKCLPCMLNRAQNWSTRMLHELQMHDCAEFVTLTYNDQNLPEYRDLRQKDMQNFFKRLRRKYPSNNIRYVYCGEYGDNTSRPHYHAIVYGLKLTDKKLHDYNNRHEPRYTSQELAELWSHGDCLTGEVTADSCKYVARYMLKDAESGLWKDDYADVDSVTGEIYLRQKPFARYSLNPAIGKTWFDKYKTDVFPRDEIILKTKSGYKPHPVPDYYLRLLERESAELAEQIKQKRIAKLTTKQARAEQKPARLAVKEKVLRARLKESLRGSSHE